MLDLFLRAVAGPSSFTFSRGDYILALPVATPGNILKALALIQITNKGVLER